MMRNSQSNRSLKSMEEGLIDEAWLQKKLKWETYFGLPINFAMVWRQWPQNAKGPP